MEEYKAVLGQGWVLAWSEDERASTIKVDDRTWVWNWGGWLWELVTDHGMFKGKNMWKNQMK